MNADMGEYYATNKLFLSQIGTWPYQHKILKVLLPSLLMIIQFSVIVTEVLLVHDTWGDIDMAVEAIITTILIIGSSAKLINIVMNNDKLHRLLQLMNNHWKVFNSRSERHILKYYADIGRKATKYYAAYCYTILVLYLIIPLIPRILDIVIPLNESRPLKHVYQAEYRVDKEEYYYPILLHNNIASLIIIVIILNIDTIYIVCVLHACSLFTAIGDQVDIVLIFNVLLLSHRLENIVGETDNKIKDDEKIRTKTHYHLVIEKHDSVDDDYRELTTCLRKHQFALEYVEMLDTTFTHATFVLLILNVIIMSVIGLHIINKLEHTEEVVRYICVAVGAFTHLICMCFPGQLLIDRSIEVFDKAYCSQWYTFSKKSKRLMRILLYRSLVPCTLSAGKMFVMSMTMCSMVMQNAMSYFTAFLSMK